MGRINAAGRSTRVLHVRMDHPVFYSAAYRALSPTARALLWELIGLFNGSNNGEIYLSVRDAERLLGVASDAAVTRAFRELQAHLLVVAVQPGSFGRKVAHATTWRLTFAHTPGAGPTRDYTKWKAPAGSRAARRLRALAECNLRSGFAGMADHIEGAKPANGGISHGQNVPKCGTANLQTPQDCIRPPVPETEAHVVCHLQRPRRAPIDACKRVRRQVLRWLDAAPMQRTQRQLARATGISESKLSRFLHDRAGRRTLDQDALDRLSKATMQIVAVRKAG